MAKSYKILQFDYSSATSSFLDILNDVEDKEKLIITVGDIKLCLNKPEQLTKHRQSNYNFAIVGKSPFKDELWTISSACDIPLVDTRLFIVNNVQDARSTLKLAKHISSIIEYYDLKFKTTLPRYDNVFISLANQVRRSPYGFKHLPKSILNMFDANIVQPNLFYNPTNKGIFDASSVNYAKGIR